MRYYIDTCVWIDFLEDRTGDDLFTRCLYERHVVLYSYPLEKELLVHFRSRMFQMLYQLLSDQGLIENVQVDDSQKHRAYNLALQRDVPFADALHAVLAKDNDAILCTRDKHFKRLSDVCEMLFL